MKIYRHIFKISISFRFFFQASDSNLLEYPPINHTHGLFSSILGLRMRLISEHFIEGSLRVRCVATLLPLSWQGNKESIFQKMDNKEAMLFGKFNLTLKCIHF